MLPVVICSLLLSCCCRASHPRWQELLGLWARASALYSDLVQGVKRQLQGGAGGGGGGGGKKGPASPSFAAYHTALAPLLQAAEEIGRKRLVRGAPT